MITLTKKLEFYIPSRNRRLKYLIYINFDVIHLPIPEKNCVNRRKDEQTDRQTYRKRNDPIRVLFLPFELRNPINCVKLFYTASDDNNFVITFIGLQVIEREIFWKTDFHDLCLTFKNIIEEYLSIMIFHIFIKKTQ